MGHPSGTRAPRWRGPGGRGRLRSHRARRSACGSVRRACPSALPGGKPHPARASGVQAENGRGWVALASRSDDRLEHTAAVLPLASGVAPPGPCSPRAAPRGDALSNCAGPRPPGRRGVPHAAGRAGPRRPRNQGRRRSGRRPLRSAPHEPAASRAVRVSRRRRGPAGPSATAASAAIRSRPHERCTSRALARLAAREDSRPELRTGVRPPRGRGPPRSTRIRSEPPHAPGQRPDPRSTTSVPTYPSAGWTRYTSQRTGSIDAWISGTEIPTPSAFR